MSIEVKTIGYRFRISDGNSIFDVISTTDLGMTKSNEIIRNFFDNFKILKSEKVVKQETVVTGEDKTSSGSGGLMSKEKEDKKVMPARKKRDLLKNIWGNLRDLVGDEFNIQEYTKALKDAGYEYTPGSWEAVPGQQLGKLVKLGKIEKIEGEKPVRYRKIKVPSSFRSDKDAEKVIKSLKDGKKVIMGTMQ